MSAVILDNLTRDFGSVRALDGLSLNIAAGQMVALLGPSGCGKTTALKIIAGLDAPTSGDVRIGDASVLGQPPQARGAVMVFQNHLLFPHMTVAQNIGFGLRMRGRSDAAAVEAMLDRVHMTGMGARRPAELSGGQAQRVALARALILQPKLLLLDEPLSNMDASLRGDMRALIRAVQADLGITTILVTHDQAEAVQMAHGIALMSGGRLQQFGTPQDFYTRPTSMAVARFFGGDNFIAGHAKGGVFHAPFGPLKIGAPANGQGHLTIRPERILLGKGANMRAGRVVQKTYLGTQTRLVVMIGDHALHVSAGPEIAVEIGAEIAVNLPPEALWFMPALGG